VLDAGIALLEEGGYGAFTIAAVCERAGVAPRALYERVDTKEALFLAVYEHGMARIRVENAVFEDDAHWAGLAPEEVVEHAVGVVVDVFRRHAPLLRAVVLISGAHPEVNRRGGAYSRELGDAFARRVARACAASSTSIEAAYTAVFSTMVVRVAYGPAFAAPSVDDGALVRALRTMVRSYLFPRAG
jgi:AcrR family transcriptional regulator